LGIFNGEYAPLKAFHFLKSLLVPKDSLLDGYKALSVCTIARCQEFLKRKNNTSQIIKQSAKAM
jgi:hypothetical protein